MSHETLTQETQLTLTGRASVTQQSYRNTL